MAYLSKRLVRVALGREPADLVIKNGRLVNVYTRRIDLGGVAIADGRIAAIGNVDYCVGSATAIVDAGGRYLVPGLVESHLHPEPCKITLTRLANAVVPRGTTSIMAPLDQIGVVAGIDGIRWVLDEAKKTPLKVFHSGASRLPYTTPASTIAHRFGQAEHAVSQKWEEAVGIWEYMSDSITDFDDQVYQVAEMAIQNRLGLHGHAPLVTGRAASACAAAGMRDDHESYTAEELADKLGNGIYGLIRRGTHSDNVPACVRAITELGVPANHLALCVDDLDCTDLTELGMTDHVLRYVIRQGVDPLTAIQMGTINAAEAYRVDHLVGSITPGRIADVLLVDDLVAFTVHEVVASGRLVARDKQMLEPVPSPVYPPMFQGTLRLDRPITAGDIYLQVEPQARRADVLCIHVDLDEGLLSRRRDATIAVRGGTLLPDSAQDVLYISVTDRHSGRGKTGSAFISGFGLKEGAIATSLSPDDDNIICIGASVDDMVFAINYLVEIGGGQVAVRNDKVLAEIRLPVCGIMADESAEDMAAMERKLNAAAYELGAQMKRPFFFLIFLSITAIPEYAMTDCGLIEHATRSAINPVCKLHYE